MNYRKIVHVPAELLHYVDTDLIKLVGDPELAGAYNQAVEEAFPGGMPGSPAIVAAGRQKARNRP